MSDARFFLTFLGFFAHLMKDDSEQPDDNVSTVDTATD